MATEAQVQGGGWEDPPSAPPQALLCSESSGPWLGTVCPGPQPLPAICLTNEAQSRCWTPALSDGPVCGGFHCTPSKQGRRQAQNGSRAGQPRT
ncbi:hypothetical protein PAL_GLEAN10024546 [Pteropus alecto]|uniref:Uncharacterized protein n=1 Tax=Pteropus alecto TaxID=9402 RepID=L5JXY2_PTEAL|nr:hypothetical protein PAL_GLEAN10024546 [Pteropus alecto]